MTTGTALSTVTEPAHRAVASLGGGSVNAIVPQTFDDVYRFSQVLAKSGLCPSGMDTPEKVSVAILTGLEIGVKPMQAVQGIAVIGGRPCIWGDLALGIVRGAGTLEHIIESFEGDETACDWTAATPNAAMRQFKAVCRVKRKGEPEVVTEFSVGDAVVAKLWGKRGYNGKDTPWITNPKRMLKMRARGFGLRDTHADVLKGLYIAEEMIGVEEERVAIAGPSAPPPPPPPAPEPDRSAVKPDAPANANAGPAAPPTEQVEEAEIVESMQGIRVPNSGGAGQPAETDITESYKPIEQTAEETFDPEAWLDEVRDRFAEARTEADVDAVHETLGDTSVELLSLTDRQKYVDMHEAAILRVEVKGQPEQAEITGKPGPAPIEDDEDDEDDFPGKDSILENEAPPLTPGEAYIARIREAVADPVRTLESLSGLWSSTKGDRQQLVGDGHLTREQVKILTAEVKARWPAPAEEPAAPPAGPETPPAEEDPAAAYDRTFRQRLEACASEQDVNALVPATLGERNKFSGHPLHKAWTEAVKQRRKQLSGIA